MLKSITIKDFKKIGTQGIQLHDLAQVNYLVGANGCGKSSILEGLETILNHKKQGPHHICNLKYKTNFLGKASEISIITTNNESFILQKTQASENSYTRSGNNIKDIIFKYPSFYTSDSEIIQGMQLHHFKIDKVYYNKPLLKGLIDDIVEHRYTYDTVYKSTQDNIFKHIDTLPSRKDELEKDVFNAFSSGKKQLLYFLNYLPPAGDISSISPDSSIVVIIDEIETHLHPKYQKYIPVIIGFFMHQYGEKVQFFISTHSPFIISAAASLPNQKVYLLEDGKTIDYQGPGGSQRSGICDDGYIAGSNGYRPEHAVGIAAKMLGAGLNDIFGSTEPIMQHSVVYFCESSNSDIDQIDQTVYKTLFPNQTFISCGDCNHVVRNTMLMNELKSAAHYIGIIDKDLTNDEIYGEAHKIKVLKRYNIESYLYDPCVIKKLSGLESFDVKDYCSKFKESNIVEDNTQHTKSNELKNFIKKYYPNQQFPDGDLKNKELAEIIYKYKSDGGKIQELYQELYHCIFGSNS